MIDCHNAMTGYWDWEHEPWNFDYVEGRRDTESDVRVRIGLSGGLTLRFHDTRFFGRLSIVRERPRVGPELMALPCMWPGLQVITADGFSEWMRSERRPVKDALMDQSWLSGIGNIYSSEGCHLAGIDPHTPGRNLRPDQSPVLLEALRCVVSHSFPKVTYQWLRVYRRDLCGSCDGPVTRTELRGRATFMCKRCQGEPTP
jgi:formamidopyrimidine-DNA glycosylase